MSDSEREECDETILILKNENDELEADLKNARYLARLYQNNFDKDRILPWESVTEPEKQSK